MDLSIVILVGGQSRRLGQDKVFVEIAGRPMIRRVADRLRPLGADLVLVAATPVEDPVAHFGVPAVVAADRFPGKGSLGGLYTGLAAAPTDWSFVMAVDMPFVNPDLIGYLAGLTDGWDVVIPIVEGRPQPTHALYSKRCLGPIERRIAADELRMIGFHDEVRVRRVDEAEVRRLDPDLLSFFNLNRPEDLDRARRIAAGETAGA